MDKLITNLRRDYPNLQFSEGAAFYWSPQTNQVFYNPKPKNTKYAQLSILHELAHAILGHTNYTSDFELLQLEMFAWERAKDLGKKYMVDVDDNYIQDCLDSYRDWLYKRSICPACANKSAQDDNMTYYQCFNCHSRWRVATSKFCRPYRHQKNESPTLINVGDSLDLA